MGLITYFGQLTIMTWALAGNFGPMPNIFPLNLLNSAWHLDYLGILIIMWWQSSRLDRIEASLEAHSARLDRTEKNIDRLAEISEATNRRIDRFVEATAAQIEQANSRMQQLETRMDQFQRAVEYLLSQDH
jgi:Tfp pilus assembly protein PilN